MNREAVAGELTRIAKLLCSDVSFFKLLSRKLSSVGVSFTQRDFRKIGARRRKGIVEIEISHGGADVMVLVSQSELGGASEMDGFYEWLVENGARKLKVKMPTYRPGPDGWPTG